MRFIYLLLVFVFLNNIGFANKSLRLLDQSVYTCENIFPQNFCSLPYQSESGTIEDIQIDENSKWTLIQKKGFYFGLQTTNESLTNYFSVIDRSAVSKVNFRDLNKKLRSEEIAFFDFNDVLPRAAIDLRLLGKNKLISLHTIEPICLPHQKFFGVYHLKDNTHLKEKIFHFFEFLKDNDVFEEEFLKEINCRILVENVQKNIDPISFDLEKIIDQKRCSRTDSFGVSPVFVKGESIHCLLDNDLTEPQTAPNSEQSTKKCFGFVEGAMKKFIVKKTMRLKKLLFKVSHTLHALGRRSKSFRHGF